MNKAYYERHTEELTAPIAAAFGVRIYDVDFSKEGSDYALCVFIDKDGGVTTPRTTSRRATRSTSRVPASRGS